MRVVSVGATPSSRCKPCRPPPIAPGAGLLHFVGATPSSRCKPRRPPPIAPGAGLLQGESSQTTTHRPGGGAPTGRILADHDPSPRGRGSYRENPRRPPAIAPGAGLLQNAVNWRQIPIVFDVQGSPRAPCLFLGFVLSRGRTSIVTEGGLTHWHAIPFHVYFSHVRKRKIA